MSLNPLQIQHTKKELRKNFELTGLSKSEIANDLKISEVKLEKIFNLKQRRLEDPWILRNYLLEKVKKNRSTTCSLYRFSWRLAPSLVFRFQSN